MPLPSCAKSSSNGQGDCLRAFSTEFKNSPGAASAKIGNRLLRLPQSCQSDSLKISRITTIAVDSGLWREQLLNLLLWFPSKAKVSVVPDDEAFDFLKHFHFLGYDLDIRAGVTLALVHSLIGQYSPNDVPSLWARIVEEVSSANQNAGTISAKSLPEDLISVFKRPSVETIPENFVIPRTPKPPKSWGEKTEVTAFTYKHGCG